MNYFKNVLIENNFAKDPADLIVNCAGAAMTNVEIYEKDIQEFKQSKKRKDMISGENYYNGKHDILNRKREVIGDDGSLVTVDNLPNNRIVNNQYKKMVKQKTNYLLGQPVVFRVDEKSEEYNKALKKVFDQNFLRLLKNIGKDSLNCGIGWLCCYYGDNGELKFKRFKSYQCIPAWKDEDHTELDYLIRIYEVIVFDGKDSKTVEKVEVYTTEGIFYYEIKDDKLVPDQIPFAHNFTIVNDKGEEQGYSFNKIPVIPFKYTSEEIPLINDVKSLQDGLNLITSNFANQMEEDVRNTILVLVNYDGENLGEFRRNLAQFGAVKVKTVDMAPGDVRTLEVKVDSSNYKAILEIFKKAIIENAMGYDAKDDRLSGQPNQMNIQSMYSDIDLDANEMETEYQASFLELRRFVDDYLYNTLKKDFSDESLEIIFNRDILINETEAIENCQKSLGILSDSTTTANHPWVDDVNKEQKKKEEETNKHEDDNKKYDELFKQLNRQNPDLDED